MGRRSRGPSGPPPAPWETERSLAAAEAEAGERELPGAASDLSCLCGGREFLLEAFLHVVDGVPKPEPVEVERLTCPDCSREFEAVQGEGGRILRGDFLGFADEEDDEA